MRTEKYSTINKKQMHILGAGLFLAAIIAVFSFSGNLWKTLKNSEKNSDILPKFSYIDSDELNRTLDTNSASVIIFDIRPQNMFNASHIPNAQNALSLGNIDQYITTIPPHSTLILVGTQTDTDTLMQAAAWLKEKGVSFSILSGGYEAWDTNSMKSVSSGDPNSPVDYTKIVFVQPEKAIEYINSPHPPLLLDVRSPLNFKQKHMENSLNIPLSDLESRKTDIPRGQEILVYGENDLESFQAGVRLFDLRILGVKTLKGGLENIMQR